MPALVEFNTPVLLALAALAIFIWAFAGFVTVDSVRRRRTDYAGVFEGRWFYAIPQGAFFVLFVASRIGPILEFAPWIRFALLATPVALAQQMAYLLRVVFPTSKRLEKRLDAECELIRQGGDIDRRSGRERRGRSAASGVEQSVNTPSNQESDELSAD